MFHRLRIRHCRNTRRNRRDNYRTFHPLRRCRRRKDTGNRLCNSNTFRHSRKRRSCKQDTLRNPLCSRHRFPHCRIDRCRSTNRNHRDSWRMFRPSCINCRRNCKRNPAGNTSNSRPRRMCRPRNSSHSRIAFDHCLPAARRTNTPQRNIHRDKHTANSA